MFTGKIIIPREVDSALAELQNTIRHLRLSDIHEHIAMDVRDCKVRIHPFKEYEGIGEGCLLYICTDKSYYRKSFNWFTFLIKSERNDIGGEYKKFIIIMKKEIEPMYDEEVETV